MIASVSAVNLLERSALAVLNFRQAKFAPFQKDAALADLQLTASIPLGPKAITGLFLSGLYLLYPGFRFMDFLSTANPVWTLTNSKS